MKSPTAIKNQRAQKVKNTHQKSIMTEVKSKSIMDQLFFNQKSNDFNIQSYIPNKRQSKNSRLIPKNINIQKRTQHQNKNTKIQQTIGSIKQQAQSQQSIQQIQPKINITKQPTARKQRKSSRIQLQLNQIIKYSSMYPSRMNSQNTIQKSLDRLGNKRMSRLAEQSIFSTQRKQNSHLQSHFHNKRKNIARLSKFNKFALNQNMFLKLVEPSAILQNCDLNKQHNFKYLIKKTKNLLDQNKTKDDLSFTSFIENQHIKLKAKKQRNTAFTPNTVPNQDFLSCRSADVRQQNMHKIHQIFRGDCRNQEQVSSYITTHEINKFQNKYDIYKSIYKRSKQGFNSQKLDLDSMKVLTVKNAVYLNQALLQSNNRMRKMEVQNIMKKFHFYN